jgi:hypothetical protein
MKRTAYLEYLYILSLITFYYDGLCPFLIICVIRQVDEALIGVSFRVDAPFRFEKQHGGTRRMNEVMP